MRRNKCHHTTQLVLSYHKEIYIIIKNNRYVYINCQSNLLFLHNNYIHIQLMKEFVITEVKTETAILVGLITIHQDESKTKEYLDELEFLADTAGAVTVKRFIHERLRRQRRANRHGYL